jgi:uncharacterized repeat protein (TIGR02543 family)
MGMAVNSADFMRTARRKVASFIPFLLVVSTLSGISVFTAPSAQAATVTATSSDGVSAAACNQEVGSGTNVVVTRIGTSCVVEFKNVGTTTWTAPSGVSSIQVMVVAGGGSGGARDWTGGGGAGGVIINTSYSVSSGNSYSVVVGGGGVAQSTANSTGNPGADSSFDGKVAKGGGGGGGYGWSITYFAQGGDGGSGGGSGEDGNGGQIPLGGSSTQTAPTGWTAFGFKGGDSGNVSGQQAGGGGGGAGGAGGNVASNSTPSNRQPGNGGSGISQTLGGKTFNVAAGGGGASCGIYGVGGSAGSNKIGGDGARSSCTPPNNPTGSLTSTILAGAGVANTGSGGGGTMASVSNSSGAGGSGIVVVAYTLACSPSTTSSGGYTYLAFKTTGICNWNVDSNISSIDYLVVGGGGGGGARHAGGGGAGGVLQGTSSVTSVTSLKITIGTGGAGGDTAVSGQNFADGAPGTSSVLAKNSGSGNFAEQNAIGGGEGKTGGGSIGGSGGSGGGALGTGGSATSGQGNVGGGGVANNPWWGSGGGGGAGGVGTAASQTLAQSGSNAGTAGNGGAGTTWANSGFTTDIATSLQLTNTSNIYFAGGGGGGATGGTAGTGGTGGGGNGTAGVATDAGAGVANTGSGGGGSGVTGSSVPKGGNGGSGVVIIRYANTLNITYNANGGTTPSGGSATTLTGGTISTLATTSYTGYVFNGWFTSSSGGTQITTSAAHNQSSNFTLYAQWTQNYSINVTQASNGSISYNGSTASETITVTSGSNATFTFTPNAGYEVESILIDGTSLSTAASPNLTNLQTAITSGYTFTNITSNKSISVTFSQLSSTDLLLNLDATRSSSLSASSGTSTPTWTSITPGATVSATGSTGTQVATGTTTSPNAPKSVYLNNNGSTITAGSGSSFNFGKTTGVSLGTTTGQTSPVTVEMWINPKTLRGTTDTPWNILFTKWFATTNRTSASTDLEFHYALKWNGSSVKQNLFTSSCSDKYGTKTFGSGADLALDAWHLVGFTVDASGNLQFYANGKPDGSSQSGCGIIVRNTSIAFVGDLIQAAGFNGSVAKVRFYKTALNAATMQSNYNADARLFAKSPIYTVTYNFDNATSGNTTLTSDYTFGGTTITLPTPSRTGYSFDGWFTQASGGSKIGDGGASYTPSASATIYARWTYNAALDPVFGSPTSTADGFTVSITNYDAAYTWATPTVSAGSVAITSTTGSTRVLTVTGLSPGVSATITQGTTKTGHGNGSATVSGSSTTGAALTPTFGTPTRTAGGFTVTITNYDADYTWDTATVTAGLVSVTSTSGSNRVLTVTGLNPGASATITQTTSRSGYSNGSATVTGTASVVVTALSIGGVTAPVRGATPVTAVTTATGYTGTVTWAAGGTPLVGNFAAGTVYTATITLTAAAGYTFTGVSANSFTVSGATATNLINSGVVTAVFPATIASITYSVGTSGSGNAPSSPTSVAIGGTFITPFSLYTRAGYSFGGWSDGTRTYAASATYPETGTVTSNVTLTAQWTGVTYTVLFNYNGRTGGDSDASKQFTTGGTAMTLPTPTRTGYEFGNWFSNVALTTLVGSAGANYEPTTNLTLYAKWNPINYTVTYNSTNVVSGSTINSTSGSVPTDATNYNIGQLVSIKSNSGSLARTGYTFAGWVTSADGTGTGVNSGETIQVGSQSINLYPKWTANTYTISYNLNGGSGDVSSAPSSWTVGNSDVTLPTTGITRTGYTFGNGSGGYWSSTQGGAAVANTYSNIGNVTLYAIWTVKTIAYSFAKGTADGQTIANFPTNSSSTFGSTITLPNLTGATVTISSNTHLFSGWSFNNTVYQSGGNFVLSETEPTFTAIWTRLYDVKYGFAGGTKASADTETDNGDSECVTSSLCTPNQVITLRGAPTRTGYQFDGWKVQDSSTVRSASSTVTITDTSYLFYAQWTAINYEFSFNSTGGSNSYVNETKNIGQLLTLPNPGTRTGYSFAGWSPDNGTTKLANGSTWVVGSSSQAFVAYWTPNVYTIIFDWQGATGSTSPNASYTVGTGNLSLPTIDNRVKDGYIFAGWSESSNGTTALSNYQPSSNKVLYAIWNDGNYSLTLDGNGASVSTEVIPTLSQLVHDQTSSSLDGLILQLVAIS